MNMSPVFSQFVRTFGNDDIVTPFTIPVAGDDRGAYLSAPR